MKKMISLNFSSLYLSFFLFLSHSFLIYNKYSNAFIYINSNIIDLDLDLDYIIEDRDLQECSIARFRV